MSRCRGAMSPRRALALLAALGLLAPSHGGPLGPLPNVTNADMGLKEGSCAVGDVVYLVGDEFPGTTPCERCACAHDGVTCSRTSCEPRPGCKALHRPDQCCPIYQCECEQAGRVYGNGEKLVDPQDPCRVCYCQGGEVVCRRIACFVRDDCTPRLVPGRCCPEYDNCPLRGVTSLPGMTPAPSIAPIKVAEPALLPPRDDTPKITIKEITPVSEIPITTDVKIKEILPSPSIEVAEYSSSKSPLITREATSEKSASVSQTKPEPETPSVVEIHSTEMTSESKPNEESKGVDDAPPSKISLSTQDSINSDIYPSNVPIIQTMGVPVSMDSPVPATATKTPMIEDDDSSLFVDHNPFPPLPDDLSVLSNHGDEIVPEPSADTDQIPIEPAPTPEVIIASVTPLLEAEKKEQISTTLKYFPDTSVTTTEKLTEMTTPTTESTTIKTESKSTTQVPALKENPTVKLRSAIPSESITASSEVARNRQEVVSSTTEHNEAVSTATSITTAATTVTSTAPPATTVTSTTPPATTVTSTFPPVTTVPSTTDAATTVPSTTEAATTDKFTSDTGTTETSTTTVATTVTSTTTAATPVPSITTEATEPPLTTGSTTLSPEPTVTSVVTEGSKSIEDMSIKFSVKPKNIDEDTTEESKVSKKLDDKTEEQSIPTISEEVTTDDPEVVTERVSFFGTSSAPESDTTQRLIDASTTQQSSTTSQKPTTSSIAKSNEATEVTLQTELSSLPIETSDQNPHDVSENVSKETPEVSSDETFRTTNKFTSPSAEVITVSKANENGDNIETTEFVLTSLGSSESATDAVELIKISGDSDKHAAIIDHSDSNKNALTDLIRLVSDVASMSELSESPVTLYPFASTTGADSEELIPVNAGYKSKNSNFNQNSITEVPSFKAKAGGAPATKQKVVEIEDEEESALTDPPPPNDKAEPTTRRPIIDTVLDKGGEGGERRSDKKDIEIITQSYVPTLSRRPPRVEAAPDQPPAPAPAPQ